MSFNITRFLAENRVTKASKELPKTIDKDKYFATHITEKITKFVTNVSAIPYEEITDGLVNEILSIDPAEYIDLYKNIVVTETVDETYLDYTLDSIVELVIMPNIFERLLENLQHEGFAFDEVEMETAEDYVGISMLNEAQPLPTYSSLHSSLTHILPFLSTSDNKQTLQEAWANYVAESSFGHFL